MSLLNLVFINYPSIKKRIKKLISYWKDFFQIWRYIKDNAKHPGLAIPSYRLPWAPYFSSHIILYNISQAATVALQPEVKSHDCILWSMAWWLNGKIHLVRLLTVLLFNNCFNLGKFFQWVTDWKLSDSVSHCWNGGK